MIWQKLMMAAGAGGPRIVSTQSRTSTGTTNDSWTVSGIQDGDRALMVSVVEGSSQTSAYLTGYDTLTFNHNGSGERMDVSITGPLTSGTTSIAVSGSAGSTSTAVQVLIIIRDAGEDENASPVINGQPAESSCGVLLGVIGTTSTGIPADDPPSVNLPSDGMALAIYGFYATGASTASVTVPSGYSSEIDVSSGTTMRVVIASANVSGATVDPSAFSDDVSATYANAATAVFGG